ncbi:hypothetical protein DERF_001849 [Dermatophagoides farinae]|uniref:Uncharacterized protein n=1 Tax=Dermatophagoides farinae TaxID=6954 RepID=A0A922I9F5_DERFA|nr:hypothetical protein DERF_001849 [Dermatophagoides farinae]
MDYISAFALQIHSLIHIAKWIDAQVVGRLGGHHHQPPKYQDQPEIFKKKYESFLDACIRSRSSNSSLCLREMVL